jgi:hypothetical protein
MKTALKNLLIGLLINITANAQCITGMPNTSLACFQALNYGEFTIGNPILVGGVAPFTYTWDTPGQNAATFLNDTTSLYTTLTSMYYSDSLFLSITDVNGLSCIDTILLSSDSNSFLINTGPNPTIWIDAGDTIIICSEFMTCGPPPLTFLWSPSTYLSDITISCPTMATDYNFNGIQYSIQVTNSLGYSGYYIHDVYTNPTSIVEVENTNKTLIKVTNILGKESTPKEKGLLFYIYSDGTVEKRIVVE